MPRRTKIVCTLGPSVDTKEQIAALIQAGMNVARLNCSHGDWETRKTWISWIRELSPSLAPVGILADLQGPKLRLGKVPDNSRILEEGESIELGPEGESDFELTHPELFAAMANGDRLLVGDGQVALRMENVGREQALATVESGGLVRSRQGVTLVGKHIDAPSLTEKDREDALIACDCSVDFIALSYIREQQNLLDLRELISPINKDIRICAKIESELALHNFDAILEAADLIMVARGDLGLQLPIEEVPIAQKEIIRRSNRRGRPVITATQMLESMCSSPRPTRAEAADVANAILDGTDAVMLSSETATGEYPLEAARTMARIALRAEMQLQHDVLRSRAAGPPQVEATEAVAHAAVDLAAELHAAAILTTTTSGHTPKMVSKFRPSCPILCTAWNEATSRQMSVVWGVEAMHTPLPKDGVVFAQTEVELFRSLGRLDKGDTAIITAGMPPGIPGSTNLIYVESVN